MKRIMRKALAMTLALALTLPPAAGASWALGTELHAAGTTLGPGVHSMKQRLWSATYSDLRTEQYITYTPTEGVRPVVAYGAKVADRQTLTQMAQTLESEGKRVLGGINGDYYVMSTGVPLGMVLSEGVLRSTPQYTNSWALGFQADGTAFIGQPALSVTTTFRGMTLAVSGGINKARTVEGGYVLLTDEFAADTKNTQAGVDVILKPLSENLGEIVEVDLPVKREAPAQSPAPTESAVPTETPAPTESAAPVAMTADTEEEVPVESPAPTESAEPMESPVPVEGAEPKESPVPVETAEPAESPIPAEGEEDPVTGSEELLPGDVPEEGETPARVTAKLVRDDELTIGSAVTCEVVGVYENSKAIEVPRGHYVLTINRRGNEWLVEQLATLTVGERMQFNLVTGDERWKSAISGIGGMYQILSGGVVLSGLDKERAPRSAVGIKADGSTVFYTLDGRQAGHSVGGTLTQVAERLAELGCVEAVCMDGGGSTTFGVTEPNADKLTVGNRPSEGSQRANSNALFLVSELEPTGELERLHVTPYDNLLLAGSALQVYAVGVDTHAWPMAAPADVTWAVEGGEGLISADGLFLSGRKKGVVTLAAQSGAYHGTAQVNVVADPDRVTVRDETTGAAVKTLALEPGQSVDLTVQAVWRNLPLISQDTACVWTVDPAAGTVDENGRFTAAARSGEGVLTVSAGSRSVTIPVKVTGHILELESFEKNVMNLIGTGTTLAQQESDLERVRFGTASARVDYDATAGSAVLAATLPVRSGEKYLSFWVYGDGSGNGLTLQTADSTGTAVDTELGILDFTGWRRLMVALPQNTARVQGLTVLSGEGTVPTGTLWLDQFTTANEEVVDEEAPTVELTVEGAQLKAVVSDVLDHALKKENITVTLDGQVLDFSWDGAGTVTAAVPADAERLHRVTVTARDASGNLARSGRDYSYAPAQTEVFEDMAGHWAASYTAYLAQQGVTNGVQTATGYAFLPENPITRGEFALMVARWQGLDLESYAGVELPFADADQIPDWCRTAVQAMYAEGVMKGSLEGENLYANAQKGINRVEAMAILGRLQIKGYPTTQPEFLDAGQIPAWSLEHVKTLVSQGVVGGYEGYLRPLDGVKRCEVAKMLVTLM